MRASATAKLNCLLIGDGSLLIQCGALLLAHGHHIASVVTASDAVADWARENGTEVVAPGRGLADRLGGKSYDWLFSIANLSLVPTDVWQAATSGAANFHDGPLPRYAGLHTPAWALLAGETRYGVTWHAMSQGIDEGDIYVQTAFDIDEHETVLTLNTKCFEAGITSFTELIGLIEKGAIEGRVQNLGERTYYARYDRPHAAGTLDFTATTAEVDRVVRALSFGQSYINPLAMPKLRSKRGIYFVLALEKIEHIENDQPGTVCASDQDGAVIATADGAVRVSSLVDAAGTPVDLATALSHGESIVPLTDEELASLRAFTEATVKHEAWFMKRLQAGRAPEIYDSLPPSKKTAPSVCSFPLPTLSGWPEERATAAIAGYFLRSGTSLPIRLAYLNDTCAADVAALPGYVAPVLPLVLDVVADVTGDALIRAANAEIAVLAERRGHPSDLALRQPNAQIEPFTVAISSAREASSAAMAAGILMTFVVAKNGGTASLEIDTARMPVRACEALVDRLNAFFREFSADGARRVSDLRLMSEAEENATVHLCNETAVAYDRSALIHGLIEAQAARTPDAIALVCEDRSLTYRELDRQANRVAQALVARGAGPDKLVGLHLNRSCELVIGTLAILKAGSAYVPLDPTYPANRIAYMIEDSGLGLILSGPGLTPPGKSGDVDIVAIDDALRSEDTPNPKSEVSADNLAYVIYTSGSTGRPKGVMVEHRNAVSFFAGMDARVPRSRDGQDVWLAVTSLSFDISVLELFWTLSHGFKVVVQTDKRHATSAPRRPLSRRTGGTDFSLFFWGNDDGVGPRKYELLLESARYADSRGFRAVWTPERHFHAFGGPYPNPSVTGAAVAAITKTLDIRAGSCVLPLHHPARVAEEWAVIDNISNGRAGLAFASGWMPEDFLLRPENAPPLNKAALLRDIETVRRLWRGEPVVFAGPGGKEVSVVTQPRPVSAELPIWVTTAGNPETYREAALLGANVLTHLLGQSIAEVGEKVALYRKTLAETGRNPADYTVTLMLHTLLGEDKEQVRDIAREPMKAYLRSAVALIKQYAWAFPAFKKPAGATKALDVDLQSLDAEELDAIIEFAFLRYFDDSGLFGTVEDALARVEQVKAIGVDEIACLIDFGVPTAAALTALEPLATVVAAANHGNVAPAESDFGVGSLIRTHRVTHLQFTPSMAAMLLIDDDTRQALGGVRHLFVGGEALQAALVRELRSVTAATIENMYGPTETTVWSSTMTVGEQPDGVVPLGAPIANTQLYVLDQALRPVPAGQPGELFIGGDGVTRGYLKQQELTAQRFLPNHFTQKGRMYRTGDLVRRDEHGAIQFIGRVDHQVKVRGYRIELGEIEAHLATHSSVAEAVVVVRQDQPNDVRIVAYVRPRGPAISDEALRAHVRLRLPDYMMPAHFVTLQKFPLTPNAKVDRSRLPRPEEVRAPQAKPVDQQAFVTPVGDSARHIADAFKRALGCEDVGMNDNFFNLGGHSLLAVQVHRDLKASLAPELTITDIYRFPTVAGLAARITNRGAANVQLGHVANRAAARRNVLVARSGRRVS